MNFSCHKRTGLLVATGLLGTLFSASAFATPLTGAGTANIGGEVIMTLTGLQWFNTLGTTSDIFDAGSATGSFAGLTGGTITDLATPVGSCTLSCTDIITFNGPSPGPVKFDLTSILAGIGTNANCSGAASLVVGAQCTPTGSPLTLTLTNTGVRITFQEVLSGYTGTNTSTSPAIGLYGDQISSPGTIVGVLTAIGNGTIGKQSYSATISTTTTAGTPEPQTILMMFTGIGLIAMGKRSLFARK
jgi:hypothetical protein